MPSWFMRSRIKWPGSMQRVVPLLFAAAVLAVVPASAADLTVGLEIGPTSIDPHFHNFNPNKSLHAHIYDPLIVRDAQQRLTPGLAVSWAPVNPTTWEFRLRPGVRFSDGTPFTADDVAFTIRRAATVQGSPSSFAFYLRPITQVEVVDPMTIRLTTASPFPLLPAFVSVVPIVSRRHGENATTADYNAGRAAIGTGAYRFASWIPQEQVVLVRNDTHWGPRAGWDRVTFNTIGNPAARMAALLSGQVDLIEKVPTTDLARLRTDPRFTLATAASPLLVTFFPDHFERVPPFARDAEGRPLERNPFRDLRVRRAVSLAINREQIVERVMDGAASATAQFMPAGFSGHLPDVRTESYDPEAARRLLAEAGYPNGLQLTIHCMNNRLINDERVCQAVGQFLTRAGIRTTVEVMPNATMITRAQRNDFSLWLHGMATETAEPTAILIPSVATTDAAAGRGAINRGRYSNPAFDALLTQALQTLDNEAREEIMRRAQRLLIDDLAVIPLYHQVGTWAMRNTIVFTARADESTLAMDAPAALMRPYEARALGSRHMAAAANRLAAQVALQILDAGGNAIDAGVAGGLALNVAHCEFTHFAGVAPIIIWSAREGRAITIDGLGGWPQAADPAYFRDHHGGRIPPGVRRSVVPGAPGAWLAALAGWGTMSFGDVAAPAIALARDGFRVSPLFNRIVTELAAEFARWPDNAALFLPGGQPPAVGSVFKLADLAGTLEHLVRAERAAAARGGRAAGLAAARDAFYRGDIARAIDRYYRAHDGWLCFDDLARHETAIESALRASFGDIALLTCGAWCQGPVLGQALGMLQGCSPAALGHNSADYIHVVAEAFKLAFADRERWYGDPRFVDVPVAGLLDPGYAAARRGLIRMDRAIPGMPPAGDPPRASGRGAAPVATARATAAPHLDTSFVCTADRHGNLFAATPSDGCFGGPMVPGTGLCPSPRGAQSWTDPDHASVLAPGKWPRLTPSPAIAVKEGRWFMPFGTPGDDIQPQAMLQFLMNHWVFGMEPQTAVEAPRFATLSFPRTFEPHDYVPDRMMAESRIDAATRAELRRRGHDVVAWDDWEWRAGCVCAVIRDRETGLLEGAADPRRPSGAIGI